MTITELIGKLSTIADPEQQVFIATPDSDEEIVAGIYIEDGKVILCWSAYRQDYDGPKEHQDARFI